MYDDSTPDAADLEPHQLEALGELDLAIAQHHEAEAYGVADYAERVLKLELAAQRRRHGRILLELSAVEFLLDELERQP